MSVIVQHAELMLLKSMLRDAIALGLLRTIDINASSLVFLEFYDAKITPLIGDDDGQRIHAYSVSVCKRLAKEDANISYQELVGTRIQAILLVPGNRLIRVWELGLIESNTTNR